MVVIVTNTDVLHVHVMLYLGMLIKLIWIYVLYDLSYIIFKNALNS